MNFIQQNLDIVLAGSAILVLILLYAAIKRKIARREREKQLKKYDNIANFENAKEEKIQEESAIDEHVEEDDSTFSSNFNPHNKITLAEVPSHGKISKEDFKNFAGIKLLVAEDNLINQKVIAGLLGESGIEVVFANDGLEVINLLTNQKDFDIVLMDAHMPNMDGYEATRKIREHPQFDDLPVIALSGDIAQDDIKKMYAAGMNAHLGKPIQIDALYDILYAFTKNSSSAPINKELDESVGIQISGGDEGFYKEILNEFIQEYEDADKRLEEFLKAGETAKADALLLDLMGVTANIGAQKTYSYALELKQTLKDSTPNYEETYRSFQSSFKKLIEEIKDYLHSS